ncbi:MAG: leucine-rich repeat domain-containing protein [Oscillospiraceae bacterium]
MKTIFLIFMLITALSLFICTFFSAVITAVKNIKAKKSGKYIKFRNIRKHGVIMLILSFLNMILNYDYIYQYHHSNDMNMEYTKYLHSQITSGIWFCFFLAYALILIFSYVTVSENSVIIDMSSFPSDKVKYRIYEENSREYLEIYTVGKKPNFKTDLSALNSQKYETVCGIIKNNYSEYNGEKLKYRWGYLLAILCTTLVLSVSSVIYYKNEMPFIFVGDKILETSSHEAHFSYTGFDDLGYYGGYYSVQETNDLTPDDLKMLKYMPNLTSLNVCQNSIDDLTEIGKLTQLEELYIGGGDVFEKPDDYSPLENLVNLRKFVFLGAEKFNGFEYLENMPELKNLTLTARDITTDDIKAIARLNSLEKLNLGLCTINDTSLLSECVNLKDLYISYTKINSLDFLKNLDNLDITHTEADDYSALLEMDNLKHLYVAENQLSEDIISKLEEKGVEVHLCW